MKKAITIIITLILCASVFALTEIGPDSVGYSYLKQNYCEPSPRSMAMGGVKIVSVKAQEAVLYNPAALDSFSEVVRWSPSLTVNMYSLMDMIKDKTVSGLYSAIKAKDTATAAGVLASYYMSAKTGNDNIVGIDLNGGYVNKGLGFRFDFSENLTSYIPNSSGGLSNFTMYTDVKFSAGLGKKFRYSEDCYVSLGASASATYLNFVTVDTGHVMDLIGADNRSIATFIKGLPVMSGVSVPVTVGAQFGYKSFTCGVVARNIIGKHSMKAKDSSGSLKYAYTNPVVVDAGVGFDFAFENSSLILEADLCDVAGGLGDSRTVLKNLHLGAEFGYKDRLFVRGGLNSGYWTFGVGVQLKHIGLDAALYSKENGSVAGDRAQKCASVRISLY